MPHYLLVKASMGAGTAALVLLGFLNGVTSWAPAVIGAVATVLAASFTYLAVLAKLKYDERKEKRDSQQAVHSTDMQSVLDRERLADERIQALFRETEKFHSEQLKRLEASVVLSRELFEQEKTIAAQQRDLIAQQAATIQQLRNGSTL